MEKNLNKSIDALVDTIPILNTLTSMENKVNENLKRMRKKMLDYCSVSSMEIDEEIGSMEVYWRTDQDPVETKIIVERIEAKDENGITYEVKLSERDMCSVVQELHLELARM